MNDTQMISLLRRLVMDTAYLMDAIDSLSDDVGSAFGNEYSKWKTKRKAFIEELQSACEVEEGNNG